MALVSQLRLVTFDATNTLMTLARPVGQQYRDLLARQLGGGTTVEGVSEQAIEASFLQAYAERAGEVPCFGSGCMSSQEWWRPLVRQTYVGSGVDAAALDAGFDQLFGRLWDHFSGTDAWQLLPGARELLEALDAYRREHPEQGLRLGVVSDWDERLPSLLRSLGIDGHFDFINAAYTVGHAKPAAEAFEAALAAAGGVAAGDCLHIGDSLSRDVRGPVEAGMGAVLLSEPAEGSEEAALLEEWGGAAGGLHVSADGLAGLAELLGLPDASSL